MTRADVSVVKRSGINMADTQVQVLWGGTVTCEIVIVIDAHCEAYVPVRATTSNIMLTRDTTDVTRMDDLSTSMARPKNAGEAVNRLEELFDMIQRGVLLNCPIWNGSVTFWECVWAPRDVMDA